MKPSETSTTPPPPPPLQLHKGREMGGHGQRPHRGRKGRRSSCGGVGRSALRGIGRCLFVSCYPVMQCFGLDEHRHRHHHHRHFH